MMRDFVSCFSEKVVEIRDPKRNSGENAQDMIACVYQTHVAGYTQIITVTWMKNNTAGRRFSIQIDNSNDHCRGFFKLENTPWLSSKKKGSKILGSGSGKVGIHWDLSLARFETGVPEPMEKYYVAVVVDLELVLLVGDMIGEAQKKIKIAHDHYNSLSNVMLIAKKKYMSGDSKHYSTRSKFCNNGLTHDITINCETSDGVKEPYLEIRIDKKRIVLVERLKWNFRGNQTILIDHLPVEVFWDVHSWVFGSSNRRLRPAMFMFQTSGHSSERAFPWYYHQKFRESQMNGLAFSLIIFASTEVE